MANEYIVPMANYLVEVYDISLRDATALAWSGLADADSFVNGSTFSYDGGSLTKEDIGNTFRDYLLGINDKGIKLKDENGNCAL